MRASIVAVAFGLFGMFGCSAPPSETSGPTGASETREPAAAPTKGEATPTDEGHGPIVANLAIEGVAVFQAVKVDVVKSGKLVATSSRNAPVVASRPALVRVYVKPGSGWRAREVTAEVRLVVGSKKFPVLRQAKTIRAASSDADLDSTFNLEVPGEDLPPGVRFQVALTAADGQAVPEGTAAKGRFPVDGSLGDLGAQVSGKLRVVVVPVRHQVGGTSHTPDVGAAQLALYEQTLMQRYPTSAVELDVHAPITWTQPIYYNGSGFSQLLSAIRNLRQTDGADDDVYYYGVVAPQGSMDAFCPYGCVAGLSAVVDEDAPFLRASIGVGFSGRDAAITMVHELGHAHGRDHSPCGGTSYVDGAFPYSTGEIGVWGYDAVGKKLIAPTHGTDMMGYCPNEWISDYTYNALFERISSVSASKHVAFAAKARYRIATVAPDGELSWDDAESELPIALGAHGAGMLARYLAEDGTEVASRTARLFRFDHVPGGFLYVPAESAVAWSSVRIDDLGGQLAR